MKRTKMPQLNSKKESLSEQRRDKIESNKDTKKKKVFEGNTEIMVSTGSTLLDLAISGTRVRGGGYPGGILVEIFGASGTGKTVMLCETAGYVQRLGGETKYNDPEARLNKTFANIFDFNITKDTIKEPDTVTQMFADLYTWEPEKDAKIHGIFADSLAALSTEMEMEKKEGDKMGMRRAKEFSEELRKFCRILKKKNFLMVCSNQVRVNMDAGPYGQKYTTPGGEAIGFYASVRLRTSVVEKLKKKIKFKGKEITQITGIVAKVEVFKNSTDMPYRTAEIYIDFKYGIDDIRANLQYLKDHSTKSIYYLNDKDFGKSMEDAILTVENENLEKELKEAVIDLWEEIQSKFKVERKRKQR